MTVDCVSEGRTLTAAVRGELDHHRAKEVMTELDEQIDMAPVSYTHQDVYKRQLFGPVVCDLGDGLQGDADLVDQILKTAVFHVLDVYKRQVTGMVICEIFSAVALTVLYRRRMERIGRTGPGERGGTLARRVTSIAVPVGATALLGNLMSAVNAALIPQKLSLIHI